MKIKFISSNGRIRNFNEVELPNFCVWTGLNGAGKTQLMDAIKQGNVQIDDIPHTQVHYYNYSNFLIKASNPAPNKQQLNQARTQALQSYSGLPKGQLNLKRELQTIYNSCFLKREDGKVTDIFLNHYGLTKSILQAHQEKDTQPVELSEPLENYINQLNQKIFNNQKFRSAPHSAGIQKVFRKVDKPLHLIDNDDFEQYFTQSNQTNDLLATSLGEVFSRYKINQYNWVHDQAEESGGTVNFSDLYSQYEKKYKKPWALVNEILAKINQFSDDPSVFNFEITTPESIRLKRTQIDTYSFSPRLVDKIDNSMRGFGELSSGEQVLLALAIAIYESEDDYLFPSLLLLDEVDASLHPSMSVALLKTIQSVFVDNGVKVILATHSPTTIAIAPEDTICVINKGAVPNKIERKPNSVALGLLTEGYATIDNGIAVFGQLSKEKINIISEGRNTNLLKRAFELFGVRNVHVVCGMESDTGKNSLEKYFELVSCLDTTQKCIFIWDCDVKTLGSKIKDTKNTKAFVLPENNNNTLAPKGIENMFPEHLFEGFILVTIPSGGRPEIKTFDKNRKKDFEEHVLKTATIGDFENFKAVLEVVASFQNEEQHVTQAY